MQSIVQNIEEEDWERSIVCTAVIMVDKNYIYELEKSWDGEVHNGTAIFTPPTTKSKDPAIETWWPQIHTKRGREREIFIPMMPTMLRAALAVIMVDDEWNGSEGLRRRNKKNIGDGLEEKNSVTNKLLRFQRERFLVVTKFSTLLETTVFHWNCMHPPLTHPRNLH